ncbi:MAG: hypothetical protein ACRCT8_00755 [Lacipirellulaceae bacterium]
MSAPIATVAAATAPAESEGTRAAVRPGVERAAPPQPRTRLSTNAFWVFADQGVASLANFAAAVIVGRFAGQSQLGLYALAMSAYLMTFSLAKAMVWTPYTRHLPQLSPGERSRYTGSVTAHLLAIAAGAGVLLFLISTLLGACGQSGVGCILAWTAPCSAVLLLREHVRRVCLARMAAREAFLFNAVVALLQVGGLAWLAYCGKVSALRGLAIVGGASALATVWIVLRRELFVVDLRQVVADWRENWSISKWLTGGAVAVELGNQGYRWLLPALASLQELGRLTSAQSIVAVANPILFGVSNFLGPVTARVYAAQGVRGLWRHTIRSTAVLGTAVGAVLVGVGLFGTTIVGTLFGEAAEGVTTTLLLTLGAGMLSQIMLIPIEFAALQLHKGRLLLQTAIVRFLVNATLGVSLMIELGAEGIGWGMLAGSCVSMAWQWGAFAREARRA